MKVQLCAPSEAIILYPQATQPEDRGGHVRGFVEIECPSDCKIEAMRLRLLAFHQIIGDPKTALQAQWATAESSYSSPPQTMFMREATLHDVKTDAEVVHLNALEKGKHVLTFSVAIPPQSPASQHHLFRRVYYDLIFFIKGRPTKSFFSLPFTFAPIQRVHVECHPSSSGARGLNVLNAQLTSVVTQSALRASIESNNARFGGCFTLRVVQEQEGVVINALSLHLGQCWKVRGACVEETRLQKEIATAKDFRRSNGQPGNEPTSEEQTSSTTGGGGGGGGNSSSSSSGRGPNTDRKVNLSNGIVRQATIQDFEYHAYFPDSESVLFVQGDNHAPLHQWQATTPQGTVDDVKVEHTLSLSIDYTSADGKQSSASFTSYIHLVKASMRTDALQLPQYSSVIEDMMRESHAVGDAEETEQAPPFI